MRDDPLDGLRRPTPSSGVPLVDEVGALHPVAPVWRGECLRLAGEASAPTLCLRQRGGLSTALAYGYMTAVRIEAGQRIEIDYVSYAVSLTGRRLVPVFEALASHRALELAEKTAEFDDEGDDPFIETISIVSTQER